MKNLFCVDKTEITMFYGNGSDSEKQSGHFTQNNEQINEALEKSTIPKCNPQVSANVKLQFITKSKAKFNVKLDKDKLAKPCVIDGMENLNEILDEETISKEYTEATEDIEEEMAAAATDAEMKTKQPKQGKKTKRDGLKENVEMKHRTSYECKYCDYKTTYNGNFRTQHKGVRYSCDYCDYKATIKCNLKTHVESKHKGVRYPCDYCDYKATQKGDLKTYVESRHEGV